MGRRLALSLANLGGPLFLAAALWFYTVLASILLTLVSNLTVIIACHRLRRTQR